MYILLTTVLLVVGLFGQISAQALPTAEEKENKLLPGDTITWELYNTSQEASVFYPKTNIAGAEYIVFSKDSLVAWLHRQTTSSDPETKKVEALEALAFLLKSPFYQNKSGIFSEWGYNGLDTAVATKKYRLPLVLQFHHMQCGEYAKVGGNILVAAGIADTHEVRMGPLNGHLIGEILINDRWVAYDLDPGEPGFMQHNTASPNGFASIHDLINDTSLITERYFWQDTLNLCPWDNLQNYKEVFANSQNYTWGTTPGDLFFFQEKQSGIWKIPGQQQVVLSPVHIKNTVTQYAIVDVTDPALIQGQAWVELYESGATQYLDSIASILAIHLEISQEQARCLFLDDKIRTGVSFAFRGNVQDSVPYLKVTMNPGPDTLRMGLEEDFYLPLIVDKINLPQGAAIALEDTTITTPGFHDFMLWNVDSNDYALATSPSTGQVNYLTDGWIYSPNNVPIEVCVAYNPKITPFGEEKVLYNIITGDTLTVKRVKKMNDSMNCEPVTVYNHQHTKEMCIPNLVSSYTSIELSEELNFDVYSLIGQNIYSAHKTTTIPGLPPGMYLIVSNGHRKKLVVY